MIDRPQLLAAEPGGKVETLDRLLGLANAIEVEAVARYGQLAALMERKGEAETAAVFQEMREIEQRHVAWVAQRAAALDHTLPPASDFTWRLPPELGASWDDVQHSQLLTPYRAVAIAVTNEERAFALYSYLAAGTDDPIVAREAEALALEELSHATELRVRRRLAFRREPTDHSPATAAEVETLTEFRALDEALARQAATSLHAIAASLAAAEDPESARLVSLLAQRESRVGEMATMPQTRPRDATRPTNVQGCWKKRSRLSRLPARSTKCWFPAHSTRISYTPRSLPCSGSSKGSPRWGIGSMKSPAASRRNGAPGRSAAVQARRPSSCSRPGVTKHAKTRFFIWLWHFEG
ncbi:MAG: ferritin family protein [Kiloniellaceae bacterium]